MNKIIKIIMILIIIIIIIIAILLFQINNIKKGRIADLTNSNTVEEYNNFIVNEENNILFNPSYEGNYNINKENYYKKIEIDSLYYITDSIIEKIVNNINLKNNSILYDLLEEDYIITNGINEGNVLTKIKIDYINKYKIEEIYSFSDNIFTSFCIKMKINNIDIYFEIKIQGSEQTYNFRIISYNQYQSMLNSKIENIDAKNIEKNENNKIITIPKTDEERAVYFFKKYITCLIKRNEEAYDLLNDEYRKKRFKDYNEFKNIKLNDYIINKIYNGINTDFINYSNYMEYVIGNSFSKISEYRVQKFDTYTEYACIDILGNYYIFNVVSPIEYNVVLDNYNVYTENDVAIYNSNSDLNMAKECVNRITLMLNSCDYRFMYNSLDENFKLLNYTSVEDFKAYVLENFYKVNQIDINEFYYDEDAKCYIFNCTLRDYINLNESKNININIQLKESNMDFSFSFNIE